MHIKVRRSFSNAGPNSKSPWHANSRKIRDGDREEVWRQEKKESSGDLWIKRET